MSGAVDFYAKSTGFTWQIIQLVCENRGRFWVKFHPSIRCSYILDIFIYRNSSLVVFPISGALRVRMYLK